ncbi:MAG: aminoacyl-tRNA hydrolase [Bacilli bacterium]|nr:aminoacyl-tRNA hydrolase [Bacilli bacterium]
MFLIVGLGNPGKEYENTRHNIGFMMVDHIALKRNLNFKEKFGGLYAEDQINGEKVLILKPQKYINLSGEVIKKYVDFYKIPLENILVVNDDMDLEVGMYKLRLSGGSAGHNGLKNIEINLNTNKYKRIKIGISKNSLIDKKDYVLGKLSKEDLAKIEELKPIFLNIYEDLLTMTFTNLMNKYNVGK